MTAEKCKKAELTCLQIGTSICSLRKHTNNKRSLVTTEKKQQKDSPKVSTRNFSEYSVMCNAKVFYGLQ
jgi:hypothetical protein